MSKMRKVSEIEKEIEAVEAKIKKYVQLKYQAEVYLQKLWNLRGKAAHKEELERDGVEINVVKIEGEPGKWSAITDEGLGFGGLRKPKLGKQRVTRRFYELMKECKERFGEGV